MELRLSKKPHIHENCKIVNSEIGQYTEVGIYNCYENVKLDDYSYTCEFCILQNVEIGKFSNVAAMVRIGPTDHPMYRPSLHHFTYRRKRYGFDDKNDEDFFRWRCEQKTYIENDTWIGHGAIVMPGIRIGNGAVVGSGAVVTRDVEPYTIVVGVPAKPIKKRFEEKQIKMLQEIAWWEWSYDVIKSRIDDFTLDIDEFINKYYQSR